MKTVKMMIKMIMNKMNWKWKEAINEKKHYESSHKVNRPVRLALDMSRLYQNPHADYSVMCV